MLKRSSIMKEIIDLITKEKLQIEEQNKLGLVDDNKYWENIIRFLMNSIYGYNLKNLNVEKTNYPGIDLGDKIEKVGVQISATKTSGKVINSLDKIYEHNVYKEYNKFKMFILGTKQSSYSIDMRKYNNEIEFNVKEDILDFNDLLEKINHMNVEEMTEILEFIKSEVGAENEDDIRKNVLFIMAYLQNAWGWLEIAARSGASLTDAYRCDGYLKRCEIISSVLSCEEYNILYNTMTEINQIIDFMEEGISYMRLKKRSGSIGIMAYSDITTTRLMSSIQSKAVSVLENREVYEILQEKIK